MTNKPTAIETLEELKDTLFCVPAFAANETLKETLICVIDYLIRTAPPESKTAPDAQGFKCPQKLECTEASHCLDVRLCEPDDKAQALRLAVEKFKYLRDVLWDEWHPNMSLEDFNVHSDIEDIDNTIAQIEVVLKE